jgi:hypothetical protein
MLTQITGIYAEKMIILYIGFHEKRCFSENWKN